MVVIDRRGSFIVSTAGYFFGVPVQEDKKWSSPVLEKFFNHSTCRTLCAQPIQPENDELPLKLSNELLAGKNTLVFFKVVIIYEHRLIFFFVINERNKMFLIIRSLVVSVDRHGREFSRFGTSNFDRSWRRFCPHRSFTTSLGPHS